MAVAGIIEGGVQTPVSVKSPRDETGDRVGVADVGWHGKRLSAISANALGERDQGLLVTRGEHNAGACSSASGGGGGADDYNDFPI